MPYKEYIMCCVHVMNLKTLVDLKDSRNFELCSKATDVTLICIFTFILKEVACGKWLRLNNITFEDPKGQQRYIR